MRNFINTYLSNVCFDTFYLTHANTKVNALNILNIIQMRLQFSFYRIIHTMILNIYSNLFKIQSYRGEGLTNAIVLVGLYFGEIEWIDFGSKICDGLLWLVEQAIPWPCLGVDRCEWLLECIWGLKCCCAVEVLDFVVVCFVKVDWGRVEGVPSASVLSSRGRVCLLFSPCA